MGLEEMKQGQEVSQGNLVKINSERPVIRGYYKGIEETNNPNWNNLAVLEDDEGVVSKIFANSVLESLLGNVPNGSAIEIEYKGRETSKNNLEYDNYRVVELQ